MMRIGDLAARTGSTVRALRYYEEQQPLLSTRTTGGHRVYAEDAVARVELIRLLIAAGVPGHGVAELLPCIYSGTTTPRMVQRLLDERERIDRQARELTATRDRLDDVIASARERLAS